MEGSPEAPREGVVAPRARGRAAARLLAAAADQAVFSGLSFGLAIAVAHRASPGQFGAFGIAYVVYTVLLGAAEAFTAEVIAVRAPKRSTAEAHSMLRDASGTAVVAGVVCAVGGLVLALAGASLASALLIPAPLLFAQDVWRFAFFASRRPMAALANDLLWAVLFGLALTLVLRRDGGGPAPLVWAWSVSGAICGLVGAVQARCVPRPRAVRRWIRGHGEAGARYAGEFLTLYGGAQLVLVSVGLFAGLTASAGYRGAQLVFGPVQVLINAMRISLIPLLVRIRARGESRLFKTVAVGAGLGASLLVLGWGLAAIALPDRVGMKVLGTSWPATHNVLPAMLFVQVAVGFGLGAILLLRAVEALKRTFRVRVTGAVLGLVLGTVGAAVAGARLAATGVGIAAALTTAALWWQAAPRKIGSAS